ncbi:MAG: ATP-binding protein [Thermodesulfobacteriota bacterium]|nr:ATP-binding protein [Thermodesulfobacteriota bacterium]
MDTWFAAPEKATETKLADEILFVSHNAIMDGILHSISGLLAILDEHRQIVSLNDSFLKMLGIDDPSEALGLRPGEALDCIHAQKDPAGCGTTEYCSTCGAAIAIVASLNQDKPAERVCALSANRDGSQVDLAMLVRSQPIFLEGRRFLLLFLQDITKQEQRAALERTFFHDVNNIIGMLVGNTQLLLEESPSAYARDIYQASMRLYREVAIQRALSKDGILQFQALWHDTTASGILEELETFFANHPVARDKHLVVVGEALDTAITTDLSVIMRVLCNMVINAFEATEPGGMVRIWAEHWDGILSFCVWNRQAIPPDAAKRVFQRNYSTKHQEGRGLGTYSMKLFGEKLLGGRVSFTSSEKDGTVFRLDHPL